MNSGNFSTNIPFFREIFLKTDANLTPKCQFLGVFVKYIPLAKDFGRKIYLHERIGAGRNALLAARGLGSPRQPVPPTTLSKLYWSISVPKMTYGLEVVPTNDYMIEELDKAHRQNARIVQNPPSVTQKPSTHATIGWLTMKSYIAIRKMVFLWSILCLPDTNIYNVISVFMIKLHDRNDVESPELPTFSMYQMICKYKLLCHVWGPIISAN